MMSSKLSNSELRLTRLDSDEPCDSSLGSRLGGWGRGALLGSLSDGQRTVASLGRSM